MGPKATSTFRRSCKLRGARVWIPVASISFFLGRGEACSWGSVGDTAIYMCIHARTYTHIDIRICTCVSIRICGGSSLVEVSQDYGSLLVGYTGLYGDYVRL